MVSTITKLRNAVGRINQFIYNDGEKIQYTYDTYRRWLNIDDQIHQSR